jgi:DNA-binding FadR family transcriptional regulator
MRDFLSLTEARPVHIIEARLFLEPAVAALAAERATDDDVKEMYKYLEIVPKVQTDEYVSWHIGFHRMVAKASQNPIFKLQVNILLDFAEDMVLSLRPKDRIIHDTTSHPAILEKLSQRDAEGTQNLFYSHLLKIKPFFESWEKQFGTNGLIRSKIQ